MKLGAAPVPRQRHRHRLRVRRLGPDLLAPGGRPRHRPGLRHCPGLHLRDLAAARPRPAGVAPAARHHHGYFRRPALRRPVRQHRRRRGPGALARHRGLALDVPRRRRARRRLRLDRVHPARIAALPGLQGQGGRGAQGLRNHRPGRGHRPPHPRNPVTPSRRTSSPARRARSAARSSACRPWSGSASSCPCCSSSWAST